jgi:hypothetical protein
MIKKLKVEKEKQYIEEAPKRAKIIKEEGKYINELLIK